MLKKLLSIFCFALILSYERGELISYELLDSKTYNEIFSELSGLIGGDTVPLVQYGSSIYSITYSTIDPFGETTIASGSITIPDTDTYCPILSFQHGTTLERDQVSSVYGYDIINTWIASAGFITVMPDFLGLGVSTLFHPYQIASPYGTDIVDMLRATKVLIQNINSNWNGQLFLSGYSEGGYATMATQKALEQEYPYEFNITLSTPMAGAHSMSDVMYNLMMNAEPYGQPWYLPYCVFAYDYVYGIYNSPSEYLKPEYAELLPPLFDGYHSTSDVNNVMPNIPIEIFKDEVLSEIQNDENHPLRIELKNNDIDNWSPRTTTLLYHSNNDELVPVENSILAYNNFIDNGATDCNEQPGAVPMNCVQLINDNWGSHTSAVLPIFLSGIYESVSRVNNQPPAIYSLVDHNIDESYFDIHISSENEVGGFQFKILGAEIESIESLIPDEISFELSSSSDLVIGFSFSGDTIPSGSSSLCRIYYINNDYDICVYESTTADYEGEEIPSINGNCITTTNSTGDVNGDGYIDVLDVIELVNYIIQGDYQDSVFDINQDSSFDILDIVVLVNIIIS